MPSDPFFIIGSGRSGSTLLRMILASHSRISIPPETWYLLPLVAQVNLDEPLDATAIGLALDIITGHYRWPDMNIDASAFRREIDELNRPRLRSIVEAIYEKHLNREGKTRWGDKTPGYIKIVPQLARLFPNAVFIHLTRDGHDVVKSFQSVGWYGHALHKNTREWTDALDCYEQWRVSPLADRIHTVRYEDLVQKTEKAVRNMCSFLQEPYEPQMLSWDENVARLVPLREMPIHAKLNRKPDRADVARWKREMTLWEVFVTEAFIGSHLKRSDYPSRFRSTFWIPAFAIVRLYCSSIFPITELCTRALRRVRGIKLRHWLKSPSVRANRK